MIIRICKTCGNEFKFRNCPSDKGFYCSVNCRNQSYDKKVIKTCIICRKEFKAHAYRISNAKYCSKNCYWISLKGIKGEKHPGWKGDNAKYAAVHSWLRINVDKSYQCAWCGNEGKTEWANKSHEYKRDMNDWVQLCHKCNLTYDYKTAWGEATRRINAGL